MSSQRLKVTIAVVALVAGAGLACSENKGVGGGTGGLASGGSSGGVVATTGGTPGTGGGGASGGAAGAGTASVAGGSTSSGGATTSGGTSVSGGTIAAGGSITSGGTTAAAGTSGTGGVSSTGGRGSGGRTSSGGATASGGTTATGGSAVSSGGRTSGGSTASGGTSSTAGQTSSGGSSSTGGSSATGGSTGAVTCTDTSSTALSFTKQYEDGAIKTTGTKTYYTMTNWWHKFGGQTVTINGLSMTIGNPQGTSVPASDGNPMGFPSIFIGTYQGHATVDSNLPKKVSDIQSVPTVFNTNASSLDTSNLNATYDVWFTASSAPLTGAMQNNPGKGGAYLMVWMYKPSARQPRGGVPGTGGTATPNYAAQTVSGVPGTWDVWIDKTDPLCISYVSSEPLDGLSYDLNNFIQDSVTKQYGITSSMYLSLVFAGFEIWSGGDGLQAKQFCAAVN